MKIKEKLLNALEMEKKGDWDTAHQIIQEMDYQLAYWIHAYLHRKEPDIANASYWYSRAKKPVPNYNFEQEWQEIHDFIYGWDKF